MSSAWWGINAYAPRGPFIDFHNRRQRWAVMVAHRRAGKTVACVADLIYGALLTRKQDARYAYVAPQYNQAKDIAWLYVKRLTADIPGVSYNEAELRANLPNGAQVRLYGADNPDRLRGMYLDGVILDEHADMRPRVWGEIVRPMLSDRKGWAAFIGTPKGHNEFHRVWQDAANEPEWFRLILRGSESGLIDQGELDAMRRSMTEDQYAQEVECSFEAAIQGAILGRYMTAAESEGRIRSVEYDPQGAGIERFIGLEHLEPGSLHIRSWGNVADGTTFNRRCRPGQVLFGKRRAYQPLRRKRSSHCHRASIRAIPITTPDPRSSPRWPSIATPLFTIQPNGMMMARNNAI
jgi:hypothetical protein